ADQVSGESSRGHGGPPPRLLALGRGPLWCRLPHRRPWRSRAAPPAPTAPRRARSRRSRLRQGGGYRRGVVVSLSRRLAVRGYGGLREPSGGCVVEVFPAGDVVLEEDLADELAAALDAGLLEDGLEVVLDRVHGYAESLRHLLGQLALHAEPGDLTLAFGEAVGERDEGGDLVHRGRLDDHGGAIGRAA